MLLRPKYHLLARAAAAVVLGFGLCGLPSSSSAADVSADYGLLKRSAHLGIWMAFLSEALERPAAISDESFRALANKICDRIEHDEPLVPRDAIEQIRTALVNSTDATRTKLAAPFSIFMKNFVGAQAAPVARSIMLGGAVTRATYNASIAHDATAGLEFMRVIENTDDLDPAIASMHDLRTSVAPISGNDWNRQLAAADAIRRTISATEEAATGTPAGIVAVLPVDPTGKDKKFRLKLEIANEDGSLTSIDSFSVKDPHNATHTLRCAVNQEAYSPARYAFPIIMPAQNDGERQALVKRVFALCDRANSSAITGDGKNRAEDVILNLIDAVAPAEVKQFTEYLERSHLTIRSD